MAGRLIDEDKEAAFASLREALGDLSSLLARAVQALDAARQTEAGLQFLMESQGRSDAAVAAPHPNALDRFAWESDAHGILRWAQGVPRGAIVGRYIDEGACAPAFAARRPFDDLPLSLSGDTLLSGEWRVSGVPFFDPVSGSFSGFRGTARRAQSPARSALADVPPDLVRQLVHEIRTPLNAILGFADMIDGEHLGPAHAAYRARAADISGQAHLMLRQVELLDRRAREGR